MVRQLIADQPLKLSFSFCMAEDEWNSIVVQATTRHPILSHVKSKIHDIAFLHEVVFAFESQQSLFLRGGV